MHEQTPADDVQVFWNSRAGLGLSAGTPDLIAKQLEIEAIAKHVADGMSVLDAGCGNGITAIELARRYEVDIVGIDNAEALIAAAKDLATGQVLKGSVRFMVGDVTRLPAQLGRFDLVYTERTLINLPDWPAQRQAIMNLATVMAHGGRYLMCENSQDGLDKINGLRQRVGLPVISPPWHNRYFREAELCSVSIPGLTLEQIEDYSSTYYFLSRVVNASLAMQRGENPDYQDPINTLALRLPAIGDYGQGKLWIWRKQNGGHD